MKTLFICLSTIFIAFGAKAQSERPLSQLAGVVIINLGAIEREAAKQGSKEVEPDVPAAAKPRSVKRTRKLRRRKTRSSGPRRKVTRIKKRASPRRKASNWRSNVLQN